MRVLNNDKNFNYQRPELLRLNKKIKKLWFYLAFALLRHICTTIFYVKDKLDK